ncbi:MAG: RHS repeat-associated core domain-containing protein, partial [Chloroflexi bacterium]|nr:RHS repeat-associated core domain-containing protein [Chloroflexota bacterium]
QTQRTDEFGAPQAGQGSSGQPFGFTGEQRDGETGLVYLRARLYDPQLGRFVQRDPVVGRGQQPQSLNRFAYVQNNPTNAVDPSGLVSQVKGGGFCFPGWPCPLPWPMPVPTPAPTPGPPSAAPRPVPIPRREEVEAPFCLASSQGPIHYLVGQPAYG